MDQFEKEIKTKQRFQFGKNWKSFLATLNDQRINEAKKSLQEMLDASHLENIRFLDIGSGSGLFSLAAKMMGADVTSFDFDPDSVECTSSLKEKYFPSDARWKIMRGSVLDRNFLESLSQFNVVYSWGVLHHTGQMWTAIENASERVKSGGKFFIALYNDQGLISRFWLFVKRTYCSGLVGRLVMSAIFVPYFFLRTLLKSMLNRKNEFAGYKSNRGMSIVHDWFDWLGGLPFEVASVEAATEFISKKGFSRIKLIPSSGLGNNQFVFLKK